MGELGFSLTRGNPFPLPSFVFVHRRRAIVVVRKILAWGSIRKSAFSQLDSFFIFTRNINERIFNKRDNTLIINRILEVSKHTEYIRCEKDPSR